MALLKYLFFLVLCIVNINSMALKGPALTRYDPCGLGVIQFEKISKWSWLGIVYLGLYKNLKAVEVGLHFEKKVEIYGASHNSTMIPLDDEGHKYVIRYSEKIPKQYIFYMKLEGLVENDTDVPVVNTFSLNNVVLCDDAVKESQRRGSLGRCGRRTLDHTELVSVRTEAKAGDWPWHVAILTRNPHTNGTSYYCGGNIISETAVVTAGHCVYKEGARIPTQMITVVAGVNNHKELGQVGRQSLPVIEVILHPSYVEDLATSDVAVLKVNKLTYTDYVQPICLWGPLYDKASLVGREATVVGFGHDEFNRPSDVLRSTNINVQNDTTCLAYSPNVYGKLINEFTICAGNGPSSGTNPRNGDSGGGLVFPVMQIDHKISFFLRGVLSKCGVSPGHTECDPKFYVVYTDVAPHYSWIYFHSDLQYGRHVAY